MSAKKSSIISKIKKPVPVNQPPHLIVSARAGTGKTTTIVEGLKVLRGIVPSITPSPQQQAVWDSIALSRDAKSVCFVAFNKSIATELQHRVPAGMDAMTMHSMGFAAVRAAYGKVQVSGHRVDDIALKLLPQYADIWDLRRRRPGLLPLLGKIVGLCKMNLLEGTLADCQQIVAHHAIDPGEDGSILVEAIGLAQLVLEKCKDVEADRAIDYDDMVWIPVVNRLPIKKYDLLLVDECQDLNRCQQELAKKAGRRLVLVGDPHQAIYGFAGADAESMRRMENELSGVTSDPKDGRCCLVPAESKCVVLPFTVTRRCAKAIVEEARKIVPDFEAHESNGPGSVTHMVAESGIVKLSYRDVAADGDMIICRLNAPLVNECFKFLKAGRKATIVGRDVGQGLISTIKATKAETVTELIHKLGVWVSEQTAKEQAKKHPSEDRLIAISDRYDCIMSFVDGAATIAEVFRKIQSVFGSKKCARCQLNYDDDANECTKCKGHLVLVGGIRLSSVHKAKGLESRRVFILQTEKAQMPHPMAKTAWQHEQEMNLKYVAITRAIEELVWVS